VTQELVKVREVEIVLVHAADGGEDRGERGLALPEDQEIHRHVAERDRPADRPRYDPSVSAVKRERAHQTKPEAPRPAAHGERAVFAEERAKDLPVTLEKQRSEAEQLDLLRVVLAREQGLEIRLLARFRGAETEQAEGVGRKPRFGHEHWNRGQRQHQRSPG
jgi:hypothetical protein